MLNSRILLSTLTILIAAAAAPSAIAERTHLFIDPSELERDFQFFAPVDISQYSGGPSPNTGFFFEYNRLYYSVSRPQTAPGAPGGINSSQSDKTWGNRYDIGYMLDEGHGWLVSLIHIDGPTGPLVTMPTAPIPVTTGLMLNIGSLGGIELNKLYRLEPLHNGSIVEPFFGVRYSQFTDRTSVLSQNNIVGGQLGFRWSTRRGRWVLTNETRLWAGHNFQVMGTTSFNEFVVAGDIRMQAAFEVSRDISLAVSFDFQHYGMGIARGNTGVVAPFNNNEDLTIYGFGFGVIYNR